MPQKKTAEPKPGAKTTEFWITAVTQVLALILGLYGAYSSNDSLVQAAAALSGGTGGLYAISRGIAKKNSNGS